jgi:uncharacterized protein (DUF983 family)
MSQTLMERSAKPSALVGILRQRCPRCRAGKIFRGSIFLRFPKMHERCEDCDLKFEREPGYFLGAMYVSYGLALATIAAIAALLWSVTSWSIVKDIAWAWVLFLPLAPWPRCLPACCGSIWINRSIPSGGPEKRYNLVKVKPALARGRFLGLGLTENR